MLSQVWQQTINPSLSHLHHTCHTPCSAQSHCTSRWFSSRTKGALCFLRKVRSPIMLERALWRSCLSRYVLTSQVKNSHQTWAQGPANHRRQQYPRGANTEHFTMGLVLDVQDGAQAFTNVSQTTAELLCNLARAIETHWVQKAPPVLYFSLTLNTVHVPESQGDV